MQLFQSVMMEPTVRGSGRFHWEVRSILCRQHRVIILLSNYRTWHVTPQIAYLRLRSHCADDNAPQEDIYTFYITSPYETAPGPENYELVIQNQIPSFFLLEVLGDGVFSVRISDEVNSVGGISVIYYSDMLGRVYHMNKLV